jgi:hypothetical protein
MSDPLLLQFELAKQALWPACMCTQECAPGMAEQALEYEYDAATAETFSARISAHK